jgi:hypothetical protein
MKKLGFDLFAKPALVAGFLLAAFAHFDEARAQNCSGSPNPNTVCAGPSSGGAGFPNFRTIVGADVDPLGSTRGMILERSATGWLGVAPGTSGLPWVSNGAGADPGYQALLAPNVNFTQSGTGAVQRTLDAKIKDYEVSVKDFGAACNGGGNDTTAIQSTITAVGAAGGGQVLLPGHCTMNATLTVSSQGVCLVGIGPKASGLSIGSIMSTDAVQFTGSAFLNGCVRNLSIDYFAVPTSGAAINIGNGFALGRITVSDVTITGAFNGINVNQSTGGATRISNVDIANTVNDGIQINGTNTTVIDNISTFQNPVGGGSGIHIINGGGIFISNSFLDGNTNGILINPGNGQLVLDVWGTNLDLDTSTTTGLTIDTSAGTGKARNMTFSNVRTGFANNGSTTAGRGIFIAGSGSTDITFTGGEDVRNVQEGIYIHGGSDIRIANRLVLGNSVQGSGTWNGINIDGGDKITISGGASGPYNDGGGNNQNFGIAVQNVFTGQATIQGVDVRGNVQTVGIACSTGSTTSQVTNNVGFNPVGKQIPTVGASPWTYTAKCSPEYLMAFGGTVSAVAFGGGNVANASPFAILLAPNQSVTTTYTVVPNVATLVQ